MTQTKLSVPFKFLLFLLLFALIAGVFSYISMRYGNAEEAMQEEHTHAKFTVILDAGHGGEDGGAVSASGLYEKDLNLAVACLVRDMLEANGVEVVMTRETDVLLYDRNTDYEGRKKALDLAARRKIGEGTPDSIFVSIHMNAYPQAQYSGLQVWYSPNNAQSQVIAEEIQATVSRSLQPENDRRVKSATSSIYLLHHLTSPAVLVECGFLSNPAEAEKLNTPEYQKELAFLIFLSIMQAQSGNG